MEHATRHTHIYTLLSVWYMTAVIMALQCIKTEIVVLIINSQAAGGSGI